MHSCETELFEIELIICIKLELALNNLRKLICHKPQTTNQLILFITDHLGESNIFFDFVFKDKKKPVFSLILLQGSTENSFSWVVRRNQLYVL